MANVRVVTAIRNARLDAIKTAVDAGPAAGLIKVYSGTQPANADAALSGNTLLATLTFTDPSAPAASGGVLTFSTITQDTAADATATAAWARITDSTGASVFDCDVGTAGATINFPTVAFVTGAAVQISSFTLTDPAV